VRPDGDAAGRDQDVSLEPVLERGAVRSLVVGDRRKARDLSSGRLELGREDQPIRLVDLAGPQRLARAPELGSRSHNGGPRPREAGNLSDPRRGESPEPRRIQARPGLNDNVAGVRIATARTNVCAVSNRLSNL